MDREPRVLPLPASAARRCMRWAGVGDAERPTGTTPVTVTSVADTTNVSFVSRPAKMASMADAVAGSSTPEP